jgi:Flp pilus assembly protein TadD
LTSAAELARLLDSAREHLAAGDEATAGSICQRILSVESTQPEALMIASALCVTQGRPAAADALLAGGSQAHPLRLEFHLALGRLRLQAGQLAEAVTPLENCILLQPENAELRHTLAGDSLWLRRSDATSD